VLIDIIIIVLGAFAIGTAYRLGVVTGRNREQKMWIGKDRALTWPREWDE
jgi:hypothetical protein